MTRLDDLNKGFRRDYLDHAAITEQVQAWATAYPELVHVSSIGTTPEGREMWLLTIGRDPDRVRPAVWIDGNMHASELAGSSVALAIAEDVLRLHLEPGAPHELPAVVTRRLKDVLFYVLPRMSPDGAEHVLDSGRYVRSVPRDHRLDRGASRWVSGDIDGDGLALVMRVQHPGGEFVESTEHPGLLVQRQIDDDGPFYKLYPEGVIANFDGHTVPSPSFVGDNPVDLNRNFPWSWAPTHEQIGAGAYPLSEPESRAVVEHTSRHPEIFAWLNLHTYGGVFIRPLGHGPDSKMEQEDLALFRQLEQWAEQLTGYPMVSGYDEFLYEPDKPLHGDLTDYAYNQRGAIAYVVELWDIFARSGMARPKKFVEYYNRIRRADAVKLAQWDRDSNGGKVFRPWRPFHHPQLGAVEVGGIDPRVGLWNPSLDQLAKVCDQQSAAFLRVAALAPHLAVGAVTVSKLGGDLTRVELVAENHGYLPTYVLASAKKLDWNEPVYAQAIADGCELVDAGSAHIVLGHLDGWGRGFDDGWNNSAYLRSRGNTGTARATWVVRGHGVLKVRIGSCRTGFVDHAVEI